MHLGTHVCVYNWLLCFIDSICMNRERGGEGEIERERENKQKKIDMCTPQKQCGA